MRHARMIGPSAAFVARFVALEGLFVRHISDRRWGKLPFSGCNQAAAVAALRLSRTAAGFRLPTAAAPAHHVSCSARPFCAWPLQEKAASCDVKAEKGDMVSVHYRVSEHLPLCRQAPSACCVWPLPLDRMRGWDKRTETRLAP